jgi:cytoplasmic iron level regulating protein YaaA (DUF328/UPF0246 family)
MIMTMTATVELTAIEEELIQIARTLPPERVAQLVDFARFLAFQTTQASNGWDEEEAAQEALDEYNTTKWDQRIEHDLETGRLDTLLAEVDAEYETGMAKSL